jgi:hypothetical protein
MGGMTVTGLRKEIRRKRLMAGKQFTTLAAIEENVACDDLRYWWSHGKSKRAWRAGNSEKNSRSCSIVLTIAASCESFSSSRFSR